MVLLIMERVTLGANHCKCCYACPRGPICVRANTRASKDSVYDITDFIIDHPGGSRIMLAAGKAIDPFWRLYQMH
eukprot:3280426-Pyramimonas_sp.AAC.1